MTVRELWNRNTLADLHFRFKVLSPSIYRIIAVASLLSAVPGWAQSDFSAPRAEREFAGKIVRSIEYQPARQPIDPRDLDRMQLVQIGQPLDPRSVAATLDRLFSTGLYDDLQVDVMPSDAGVSLRFITRPRRFVGHVDAVGAIHDPPSRAVVLSDSQLSLGTPFDEESLVTAKQNILSEMRRNGLYSASVETTTIEDPLTHQMTIRFLVNSGARAKYDRPVIVGNPKLATSTVIRATGWKLPLVNRWRGVSQSLTDKGVDGIQRRYANKDRLTTTVDVRSLDYDSDLNRLKATLDIEAGPRIQVQAREAKISKSKLHKYIPIYQEGSVDNDLLAEGARNLKDYFQSRGYPDVDVTWNPPTAVKNDQQTIIYDIATGPRRKLVNVEVVGNTYFLPETLDERMFLKPKSLVLRYGRYSEAFRHQDEDAIQALYQANGFRDARVTSTVETNYRGKENDLAVQFHVYPGVQWRVAALQIQGPARHSLATLEPRLASAPGQPFADINIANDRNMILEDYYAAGFPNTRLQYTTNPGPQPHTVNLTYSIREGPQQFVRKVIISGLERTRPSLVTKRLDIHADEPVSLVKINDVSRQLSDLGIFANVTSAVQDADGQNIYKDVVYDFDEAARYTYNVGFGLQVGTIGSTTSNLSASGGSSGVSPIVAFDVSRLNFMGRGQTIALQTKYSNLEQRYAVNYILPRFLGSVNRNLTFSVLYDRTTDVQTFSSRRAEASIATSQRFNRASSLVLRFAYRRVSTGDIVIPSLLIPSLLQPVRIGIFSGSYIQDHRDNPADAHHGFWNTVDAGVAGGFFGSQRSFVRVLARNATYTQLTRNLVLARQTQLGGIIPFNVPAGTSELDDTPLPERFFGGGGVSMRGFGYNQAGPRDIGTGTTGASSVPTGFPIGGDGLLFNNVELRFPLLGPNITGVFFHDLGNIYSSFSKINLNWRQANDRDFNYALQAAGFGIRYKTPLGPVRVDLSYALNPTHYQGFGQNETIQDLIKCTPQAIANGTAGCVSAPQTLQRFQFFFSIGQAF